MHFFCSLRQKLGGKQHVFSLQTKIIMYVPQLIKLKFPDFKTVQHHKFILTICIVEVLKYCRNCNYLRRLDVESSLPPALQSLASSRDTMMLLETVLKVDRSVVSRNDLISVWLSNWTTELEKHRFPALLVRRTTWKKQIQFFTKLFQK